MGNFILKYVDGTTDFFNSDAFSGVENLQADLAKSIDKRRTGVVGDVGNQVTALVNFDHVIKVSPNA